MSVFLQYLISGLSIGAVYALIALGYTMVYGILKLINFAHGEIYMLGAFIAYYMIEYTNPVGFGGIIVVMTVTALITAIIGMLVERIAYRPMRNSGRISVLLTALGVSIFLQNLATKLFGAEPKSYPKEFIELKLYKIKLGNGEIIIKNHQIIIILVSIFLMTLLFFIIKHTKTGKAMRAVAYDKDAAKLMGINTDKTISITFGIGSALAAIGGIMQGVLVEKIEPTMGLVPGLKAFIAAVLGGIGSIPGAVLGGVIMGMSESMVTGYISSVYKDVIAFLILILVLLVKPSGILLKNTKEKV